MWRRELLRLRSLQLGLPGSGSGLGLGLELGLWFRLGLGFEFGFGVGVGVRVREPPRASLRKACPRGCLRPECVTWSGLGVKVWGVRVDGRGRPVFDGWFPSVY